ncbi:transposase [Streptomyces sp. NPDC000410]|uniref:transposase n=1 Tax=Streptomyces sp. NPDC000410 TaxID=3154254 RepID=UPI00331A3002
MAEKRWKFEAEFREGAVRIVAETGKPIAQVARELGIDDTTPAGWVSRGSTSGAGDRPSRRSARSGAPDWKRGSRTFRLPGDTYGSPRITLDLWAEGWKAFVDTVAGDHGRPGAAGP